MIRTASKTGQYALIAALAILPVIVVLLLFSNAPESNEYLDSQRSVINESEQQTAPFPNPPPLTEVQTDDTAEAGTLRSDVTPASDGREEDQSMASMSTNTVDSSMGAISNQEDISRAISNIANLSMFELMPIIEQLNDNDLLRREWLEGLMSNKDQVKNPATPRVLGRIAKEELIPFLKEAVSTGDSDLLKLSINALTYRNDIDPMQTGIIRSPMSLLPSGDDAYTYANSIEILTNRGIGYTEEEKQQLSSSIAEGLYDDNHVVRFASIQALFELESSSKSALEEAALQELNHSDSHVRNKAMAQLDYWLESGYQPSDYAKAKLVNQVIADYSNMGDGYANNVAYLLSNLRLSKEQAAQLKAAGVSFESNE